MRFRPWHRGLAALALLPLLNGCVAAVAIPFLAGGTMFAREHGVFVRAATPSDAAASYAGPPAALPARDGVTGEETVTLTALTALPVPTGPVAGSGAVTASWQPFVDYALVQGEKVRDTPQPQSALIVSDGLLVEPHRRPCTRRYPAVIVDLDPARSDFAPGAAASSPPGLAAGLARLRADNILVLWLTQLPASRVGEVSAKLRATGLDPDGKDQFLLVRGADDRKQVLREQANEDVCVIAIAGDRRGDFDELFDYLRDPDTPNGLDAMLGSGWFLLPPPLVAPTP
ncbi:MAG: hypothetical protein ABIT16_04655 [Croceibacterium sp.]